MNEWTVNVLQLDRIKSNNNGIFICYTYYYYKNYDFG